MKKIHTFKLKAVLATIAILLVLSGVFWWQFLSLKPYSIDKVNLHQTYQRHANYEPEISFTKIRQGQYKINFTSFDGDLVEGRLELPEKVSLANWKQVHSAKASRIMLGVSAMGRNYLRWWQDSFKDRPTVTQVNKLGELALTSGQILVAIDARYHGTRKVEYLPLSKIMNDLHIWGERAHYEEMIVNTVLDYKHLINGLELHFGDSLYSIAGYSMGGQISLLLASTDARISQVLSIVPPHLDNKVAIVAPVNLVDSLYAEKVWLVIATNDENAKASQNKALYNAIHSKNKKLVVFDGEHILPDNYPASLIHWFNKNKLE